VISEFWCGWKFKIFFGVIIAKCPQSFVGVLFEWLVWYNEPQWQRMHRVLPLEFVWDQIQDLTVPRFYFHAHLIRRLRLSCSSSRRGLLKSGMQNLLKLLIMCLYISPHSYLPLPISYVQWVKVNASRFSMPACKIHPIKASGYLACENT
jgi:hypothetical protein